MRFALAALLLGGITAAHAAAPATSLERPFAAGGRITMDLSAGEYDITGPPTAGSGSTGKSRTATAWRTWTIA